MRSSTLAICLVSIGSLTISLASCGGGDTPGTGGAHATTTSGTEGTSTGGHGGSTSSVGTGGDELIDSGAGCNEGDPCGDSSSSTPGVATRRARPTT